MGMVFVGLWWVGRGVRACLVDVVVSARGEVWGWEYL